MLILTNVCVVSVLTVWPHHIVANNKSEREQNEAETQHVVHFCVACNLTLYKSCNDEHRHGAYHNF